MLSAALSTSFPQEQKKHLKIDKKKHEIILIFKKRNSISCKELASFVTCKQPLFFLNKGKMYKNSHILGIIQGELTSYPQALMTIIV